MLGIKDMEILRFPAREQKKKARREIIIPNSWGVWDIDASLIQRVARRVKSKIKRGDSPDIRGWIRYRYIMLCTWLLHEPAG
jgi:hypothetical protein